MFSFIAERTTRNLARRLGQLAICPQTARDMADQGQGLMVGNCNPARMARKLAWVTCNLRPNRCLVVCHSYVLAAQVAKECTTAGEHVIMLGSGEKPSRNTSNTSAIITVPENLYRIQPLVAGGRFDPPMLFLLDPEGLTFRSRCTEWGGGSRALNVATFRAGCLATGCQILAIACVSSMPNAFGTDIICRSLGVEAMVYADGRTFRSAFGVAEPFPEVGLTVGPPVTSPLDAPVTAARQAKSRVLIHVSETSVSMSDLIAELAAIRSYPRFSLEPYCENVPRLVLSSYRDNLTLQQIAMTMTTRIALINKQVVAVEGAQRFYEHLGTRNALYVLGCVAAPSLLLVPGPVGYSARDLTCVCDDIRKVRPDFVPPSLHVA